MASDAFRRRDELAKSYGYKSYGDMRRRREAGNPLPTDRTAAPERRQVIPTGGLGRIVTPTGTGKGENVIVRQVERAIRDNDRTGLGSDVSRLYLRATVAGRDIDVFRRGGWSPSKFRRAIAEAGSVAGAVVAIIAGLYEGEPWADDLTPDQLGGNYTLTIA